MNWVRFVFQTSDATLNSIVRYLALFPLLLCACSQRSAPIPIQPAFATQPVNDNADDCAIWANRSNPQRSLIFGTNHADGAGGALMVYDLSGKVRQTIGGIESAGSVDVEYNISIGGRASDLLVLAEQRRQRLRIMRVWPDGSGVEENSEIPVFEKQMGDFAEPVGLALYRRPSDGSVFAIVGRKKGPRKGYLWQYRLFTDDKARVRGEKIREFGDSAGNIRAVAVDDEAGFVYYADADDSIRKWHADPDHPAAAKEVARFGIDGFRGSRAGIAIYAAANGEGYIVCTDQTGSASEFRIYDRKDPSKLLKVISGGGDTGAWLDVSNANLGKDFARGMMVAMNGAARNYLVFRWADIVETAKLK